MRSKQAGKRQCLFCSLHRPCSQIHTAFQIYISMNARTETIPKVFTPLSTFSCTTSFSLPMVNGNPSYPQGFGTHHHPTYFNLQIGIIPPTAIFFSLHPPFSFQTPVSAKTTRMEPPKLSKPFQQLSCWISPAEKLQAFIFQESPEQLQSLCSSWQEGHEAFPMAMLWTSPVKVKKRSIIIIIKGEW